MAYSAENRSAFDRLCDDISRIVPFVGAGLSAFLYPCWKDFLNQSAQNLNPAEKSKVQSLLDNGNYEEAAGIIEKSRGDKFRQDIIEAFGEQKLKSPEAIGALKNQAVYILPELFEGLVLTTNFDRTLEHVYELRGKRFKAVGHPPQSGLLSDALKGINCPCLFKLHGDIESPDRLVLTGERYDFCYREGGALVRELEAVFSKKSVLFLGCSLEQDRTMDVFDRMLNPGITHYAIVGSAEEDIGRKRTLSIKKNIQAVIYPEKEYSAVKTILEKASALVGGSSCN